MMRQVATPARNSAPPGEHAPAFLGSSVLVTVPFGKGAVFYYKKRPQHRVYNWEMLQEALSPLDIVKKKFLMQKGRDWAPASVSEVEEVDGETTELKGLALIVASKKSDDNRKHLSHDTTEENA